MRATQAGLNMFDKDAKVLSARVEFLDFHLRSPSSITAKNLLHFLSI